MIKKMNKKILNFLDNIYLPVTLQSKQSEISFYWKCSERFLALVLFS